MESNEHQAELEDVFAYMGDRPRVYLGCSLTSPDATKLRTQLLEEAAAVFRDFGFDVYNPADHTPPGSPHSPEEVYSIDHANAMCSDVVFFIRLQASFGMGIESQIAADMLIPWGDVKIKGTSCRLTPLVYGLPNCGFGFQVHLDESEPGEFRDRLLAMLRERQVIQRAKDARQARVGARERIRHLKFGRFLRRQRLLLAMPVEELANQSGVPGWWIESIERDERLAECLSLVQLRRLMTGVRLSFAPPSGSGFLSLQSSDQFDAALLDAADEFTDYTTHLPGTCPPLTDSNMLARWREWIGNRGLELEAPAHGTSSAGVTRLVGYVSMPVSNVDKSVEEELQLFAKHLVDSVRDAGLPVEITFPQFQRTNREERATSIYEQTISAIYNADLGIVILAPPATGVGVTAKLFCNTTLPCILAARDGEGVSRMLLGAPFPRLGEVQQFTSTAEAAGKIVQTLSEHIEQLKLSAPLRQEALAGASDWGLANAIERFRVSRGLSHEEAISTICRVPFLRSEWLESLVRVEGQNAHVTLLQLGHIVQSLGWRFDAIANGDLRVQANCEIQGLTGDQQVSEEERAAAEQSLTNLLDARSRIDREQLFPIDDSVIFDGWEKYCHELTLDAGRGEEQRLVRSVGEWVEVLLADGNL
jgi:nucleoside 2-deoxyribosyltransferase